MASLYAEGMTNFRRSAALLALLGVSVVQAVNVPLSTPAPGTATRKAILDAVRVPTMRHFSQKLISFKVVDLKVGGGWAFVRARPLNAANEYLRQETTGAPEVWSVLHLQRGQWKVRRWAMPTDVISETWEEDFPQAPRNLWPHHRW